jgi:hypothetical protein
MTREAGRYLAILDQRAQPPAEIEQLRALLTFAAVAVERGERSLDAAAIDAVASALRGMDRRQNTDLRRRLAEMEPAATVVDLATSLDKVLDGATSDFGRIWRKQLQPWLQGTVRLPKSPTGPGGGPKKGAGSGKTRDDDEEPVHLPICIAADDLDPGPSSEPRAEGAPAIQFSKSEGTPPGKKAPLLRDQLVNANKTIRRANTFLLHTHVDVLSQPEILAFAGSGLAAVTLHLNQNLGARAAGTVISLLVLALGRGPEVAADVVLLDNGGLEPPEELWHSLVLDAPAGVIWVAAIRPPDAFEPAGVQIYIDLVCCFSSAVRDLVTDAGRVALSIRA